MNKYLKYMIISIITVLFSFSITKANDKNNKEIQADTSGWIQKSGYLENKQKTANISIFKFSLDGRNFFTYGSDNYFRTWDNETGKIISEKKMMFSFKIDDLIPYSYVVSDISPDGQNLLITCIPQPYNKSTKVRVIFYNINYDKVIYNIEINTNLNTNSSLYTFSSSSEFSPDGSQFINYSYLNLDEGTLTNTGWITIRKTTDGSEISTSIQGYLNSFIWSEKTNTIAISYLNGFKYKQYMDVNLKIDNEIIPFFTLTMPYYLGDPKIPKVWKFSKNEKFLYYIKAQNDTNYFSGFDIFNKKSDNLINLNDNDYNIYCFTNDDSSLICNKNQTIFLLKFPTMKISSEREFNFSFNNSYFRKNRIKNELLLLTKDSALRKIQLDLIKIGFKADFYVDKTSAEVGSQIQFIDNSAGNPNGWLWDFGDGTTSNLKNPLHTYTKSGTYTVKLDISNIFGHDAIEQVNYINITKRYIDFSSSKQNVEIDDTIQFQSIYNRKFDKYIWDFGDSSDYSGETAYHSYKHSGLYTVTLHVIDGNGIDSVIKTQYIHVKLPIIDFTVSKIICSVNDTIIFTATGETEVKKYSWDFSDGNNAEGNNISHSFKKTGNYSINLSYSNNIDSGKVFKQNYIIVQPLSGIFESLKNYSNLSISPNPATDYIKVNIPVGVQLAVPKKIELYSIEGILMQSTSPQPSPFSERAIQVDVSGLIPGVYFVKMGDKVAKFVKM